MRGKRLGPYEILASLGAGGMGEVYRARDTTLDRDVAIKVLPESFTADPDRLMRFEREAKALAALNHPNVCAIYSVGEAPGPGPQASEAAPHAAGATAHAGTIHFLVMELVEGPTLEERLRGAGPTPASGRKPQVSSPTPATALALQEALAIARQIADALEAAHEAGIIHRDLKPANIKVRADGMVKVLDFGLAKAVAGDPATETTDAFNSPTVTSPAMTAMGVILGTAAYMAPEQAKEGAVDKRADIWAFGCVLYELLTGTQGFVGESVTETLAAVLNNEPDWGRLPPDTPPHVRVLLQRCLQKDPKQRLRDIGDARIVIDEVRSGTAAQVVGPAGAAPVPVRRRLLPWGVTAVFAIAAAVLAAVVFLRRPASPSSLGSAVLAYMPPPANTTFNDFGFAPGPVVISPDGRQLAFSVTDDHGVTTLYVRPLASHDARPVAGTEDAEMPFWSPDSGALGFFAGGKLKTVTLANDSVQVLADASCHGAGAAWGAGGAIVFTPQCAGPLVEIASSGGKPRPVTELEPGASGHGSPAFLPDGKHFLYVSYPDAGASAIWLAALDSSERTLVLKGADEPAFASGHLLFATDIGGAELIDWSPDGRYLTFDAATSSRSALWVLPLGGDHKPFQPAPISVSQFEGSFSPDGRWLAYFSYETGRPEIFVVPFPGPGGKFQISQNGGWLARWDQQGHLYFLTMGNRLTEAELATSGRSVQVKAIHPLFQLSLPSYQTPFLDVSADGNRFVVITSTDPTASRSIGLLLDWPAALQAKAQ
jgi:eukaryotic-like serine/threonine-protein kinase